MASSDFDKPPSGMIKITGKKVRAEPTDSKMVESNLSKNQQSGKGEKSTASLMSGAGSTVPVLPSNYSLDLSLLFGLYGPGNLSYQFATSPNGSMLPFGLFPFGLAVPSLPVQQQTATNIINTSELTRVAPQSSLQHAVEKPKENTEKFISQSKGTIPPSLNVQCSSKNPDSNRRKISSSPAIIRSESTKTISAESGFTFRSPSSNLASKHIPYIQKPVTVSTTTKVSNLKNKHSGSTTRTNDLTKKPRQQRQTQSGTHKIATPNNLALMQSSSFRDAEAATILLGLRHGVHNIVTQAGNTNPQHVVGPNSTALIKGYFSESDNQNKTYHTFSTKAVATTTLRKCSTSTASHDQTTSKGNHSINLAFDPGKQTEPKTAIVHRPISSTNAKETNLKRKSDSNYTDGTKVCACAVECTRQNEHNIQQENGGFNFKKIICKKFTQSSDKNNERQIQDLQTEDAKIVSNAINTYNTPSKPHSLHNSPRENSRVISTMKVTKSKSRCTEKYTSAAIKQKETKSFDKGILQTPAVKETVVSSGHSTSISKPHTPAASLHLQSHKANHPSLLVSETESKMSNTAPSFSELRQISAQFSGSRHNFDESLQNNKIKQMLPKSSPQSSNLYRLRESGMGDSNDSLHSIESNDDDKQEHSGDESETSCSSSEESNADSDVSDDNETTTSPSSSDNFTMQRMPVTSRSTFTLSRPKFTPGLQTPGHWPPMEETSQNVKGSSGSKVKIRRPTFTFPSGNIQSGFRQDSNKMKKPENVPELKFDDNDHRDQSFKSKFIRALEKPDSKGLAVDEKSLRALLGEATCFYHNNKKYVLKRALTKCKPKEGFIADVDGTDGNLVSIKNICKDNDAISERLSSIEPRLSVTATKKSDEKIKSKRSKTHKIDLTDKRFDLLEKSSKSKIKITLSDTHNKRHRRTHEIDNLVFEGAGGLTPMPDISLRDSDVFSNIKLRRREAAKRGIKETDKATCKLQKLEGTNKVKRKSLRIKTHKRALLNSITKHTIDSKLRKRIKQSYHKARSTFFNSSSCVRISAGADKPHLDAKAYTSDEFCNTSITDAHPSESTIYTAAPESKQSLVNEAPNCDPGIVNEVGDNEADMSSRNNFTNAGYTIQLSETCSDNKYLISNVSPANEQQEDCLHRTSQQVKQFDHVSGEDQILDTKNSGDLANSISTDSVQSKCYDRRKRTSQKSASKASKSYKFGFTQRRSYKFSILSNFDAPSAITLDSVFGDLQPSYSVKNQRTSWVIGTCAQDTKQKIQRKLWQNMTLDMFSNS